MIFSLFSPVLLFICYIIIFAEARPPCPNGCSGNGICANVSTGLFCGCFPGFVGIDCSQRVCTSGLAWVGIPDSNDSVHRPFSECSNMGYCDRKTGDCKCREGFTGAACEQTLCPTALTPEAFLNGGTDQRVCSGNGRCLSLREVSLLRSYAPDSQFTNANEAEYTDWDADRIYGCICDEGWTGAVCSLQTCAEGVDPLLLSSTENEVQLLECQCNRDIGCHGGLYLQLDNEVTAYIPYSSTAAVIKQRLEQFQAITTVDIKILQSNDPSNPAICSGGDRGSVTQITFLQPKGPVSRLIVQPINGLKPGYITIRAKGEVSVLLTYNLYSVASTAVLEECSGRGDCNRVMGTCQCQPGYTSSDGYGNLGSIDNCGHQINSGYGLYSYNNSQYINSTCPIANDNICNSPYGVCDSNLRCQCVDGYGGYDCTQRTCQSSLAFFGLVGQGHTLTSTCAGVGDCNTNTGICTCTGGPSIYGGDGCQRFDCAVDSTTQTQCGGVGTCLSISQLKYFHYAEDEVVAPVKEYSNWDGNVFYGCLCSRALSVDNQFDNTYLQARLADNIYFNITANETSISTTAARTPDDIFKQYYRGPYAFAATNYFGYSCGLMECPKGDDPRTYGENEIQHLNCRANNGTFTLLFRDNYTLPISFNSTAKELQLALEQLPTIGSVGVSIKYGDEIGQRVNQTVCTDEGNNTVSIEFLTEFGSLPLLQANINLLTVYDETYLGPPRINITRSVICSKEDVECSALGICNESIGRCSCLEGYGSSNGSLVSPGERGDCSWFNKWYTQAPQYQKLSQEKKKNAAQIRFDAARQT